MPEATEISDRTGPRVDDGELRDGRGDDALLSNVFLRFQGTILMKGHYMARYSRGAQKTVKQTMHKRKQGTLKSGSGKKVTSRKQAIAIGLSEARTKGKRVPSKTSSS